MFSQFANNLVCQYCGKENSATRWPTQGDMVPFLYQKEPGRYQVTIQGQASHSRLEPAAASQSELDALPD
jgi:hypothetical protein